MRLQSLRARLLAAAAAALLAALLIAGGVLAKLFERHVDTRVERELDTHLQQIASLIESDADGQLVLTGRLADPRYDLPFSGLYWQVFEDGKPILSSSSIGDEVLPINVSALQAATPICLDVMGPLGRMIVLVTRPLKVRFGDRDHALVLSAALDQSEIDLAVKEFTRDIALSLLVLGVCLLSAAWLQVRLGLAPLNALRDRLLAVRAGKQDRIGGHHPVEVQGLVDQLDALLEQQQLSLTRARARAGDLAHGMKTPLMALGSIARDLDAKGDTASSEELSSLVERMQGHVMRELARTQIIGRSARTEPTELAPLIHSLIDTLRRLPRGALLTWTIDVDAAARVSIERGDLQEMIGNVLENAMRFATSRVQIAAYVSAPTLVTIEDDGPGVPEDEHCTILRRGISTDDRQHTGLGLAIVGDIAETYGLRVRIYRSPMGGLGVAIEPPPTTDMTAT